MSSASSWGVGLQDALTIGAVPEQVQDRGDRDAQATDTGPPAHDSWIVRDAREVHGLPSGLFLLVLCRLWLERCRMLFSP